MLRSDATRRLTCGVVVGGLEARAFEPTGRTNSAYPVGVDPALSYQEETWVLDSPGGRLCRSRAVRISSYFRSL